MNQKYIKLPYRIESKSKAASPSAFACEQPDSRDGRTAAKFMDRRELFPSFKISNVLPCHKRCTGTVSPPCGSSCVS